MGRFNGPTPKRHRLWSNDQQLLGHIADRAGYMSRSEQSACTLKTAKVYVDRWGVKRRVGIKQNLRDSQRLCSNLGCMDLFWFQFTPWYWMFKNIVDTVDPAQLRMSDTCLK